MQGLSFENKFGSGLFTIDFDLDLYHARDFKETVLKAVSVYQLKKVILNFFRVKYLDSSGIGALIGIHREISPSTTLRLCCLPEGVLKSLRLARVENLFNIDPNEEESLKK